MKHPKHLTTKIIISSISFFAWSMALNQTAYTQQQQTTDADMRAFKVIKAPSSWQAASGYATTSDGSGGSTISQQDQELFDKIVSEVSEKNPLPEMPEGMGTGMMGASYSDEHIKTVIEEYKKTGRSKTAERDQRDLVKSTQQAIKEFKQNGGRITGTKTLKAINLEETQGDTRIPDSIIKRRALKIYDPDPITEKDMELYNKIMQEAEKKYPEPQFPEEMVGIAYVHTLHSKEEMQKIIEEYKKTGRSETVENERRPQIEEMQKAIKEFKRNGGRATAIQEWTKTIDAETTQSAPDLRRNVARGKFYDPDPITEKDMELYQKIVLEAEKKYPDPKFPEGMEYGYGSIMPSKEKIQKIIEEYKKTGRSTTVENERKQEVAGIRKDIEEFKRNGNRGLELDPLPPPPASSEGGYGWNEAKPLKRVYEGESGDEAKAKKPGMSREERQARKEEKKRLKQEQKQQQAREEHRTNNQHREHNSNHERH